MESPESRDSHRNVVWALVVLVLVVVVVSTTRARAAPSAEDDAEPRTPLTADQLTPVPMSVEVTGAPSKAPLNFTAAFAETGPRTTLSLMEETKIVDRARLEIERVSIYDNSWMETSSYPMGDVPGSRGACTDVVVRSLREIGVDLQELVHDDVARDPASYNVVGPDPNIDHRRLSTMYTFFTRHAMSLTTEIHKKSAWRPGDIVFVAWQKRTAVPEHVGIISDRIGPRGYPLIIENGGPKPVESDSLGRGKVIGHFRAMRKPAS